MKKSRKIIIVLLAVLVYLKLRVDDAAGRFAAKGSGRKSAPYAGDADHYGGSNRP